MLDIYIYNCGSHKKLKSNNRLENCQVFHETQHFFEIFEITRTGGSFLLFFSNTWYQCFFDSQFFFKYPVPVVLSFWFFFFKYPQPVVLSFWFFFSSAHNQWFFDSDLFFRMPATSGYYNNERQAPTLEHTREGEQARTRMGWWRTILQRYALLKQGQRDHTTWQNQPFIRRLTSARSRSATKNTRGRVGSLPWPRWTSTYTGTFTFMSKAS